MLPWISVEGRNHELVQMFWQSTVPISVIAYCLFLEMRYLNQKLQQDAPFIGIKKLVQMWDRSTPVRYLTYACIGLLILGFAPSKMSPFIYFQF
jgi:hypothetical protein